VYVLGYLHLCVLPTRSFVGAYYAAQVGISLKAVSTPNRTFLAALLTSLESLRSSVGSSDAITVESAASAYVENFALRVFASADDEDRRGLPTRKTAKKFLAASTFFDVLNVFEDRGAWEAVSSPMSFSFLMKLIYLYHFLPLRIRFSISPACGENALC
jgi:vacuolar protein sorting-associated protein VTA1